MSSCSSPFPYSYQVAPQQQAALVRQTWLSRLRVRMLLFALSLFVRCMTSLAKATFRLWSWCVIISSIIVVFSHIRAVLQTSVRSALLARVHDTHVPVLEALYSNSEALLPLVLNDPSGYIQTVSDVLHSQTSPPSRHVIKAHLSFIASHLYPRVAGLPNGAALAKAVFETVFFPFLLFSKPRHRTAALVWEIIEAAEKSAQGAPSLSRYELLGGCLDAVRWEEAQHQPAEAEGENAYHATEALAKVDVIIAAKIAGMFTVLGEICISHAFLQRTWCPRAPLTRTSRSCSPS